MNLINSTRSKVFDNTIVKGKGTKIYNNEGKSFLDFEAGVWCLPLGHCPDELNIVYSEQSKELIHVGYSYNSPILGDAANRLLDVSKIPNGKCVFLSSGSEAVEYAVQVAMKTNPNLKGCRLSGYYLSAYGSASKSNQDWIEINDNVDNIDFSQIGFFLFEPGNYSGMVKLPNKKLVLDIIEKVKENNGLIIVDEVTTGIGRTGKWFGYMHYNLTPDIIAVGKGLGNGYPISAVIIQSKIIEIAMKNGFGYAQSHQNDPLGAKIAHSVIDLIEKYDLINNSRQLGYYFKEQLTVLKKRYKFIEEVRGIGLMNTISFFEDIEDEIIETIKNDLFNNGILVQAKPNMKLLRLYPPLNILNDEIDYLLEKLDEIFSKISILINTQSITQ